MRKPTTFEKRICKDLGVTPVQLMCLARAAAGNPHGEAGGARGILIDRGLLAPEQGSSHAHLRPTDAGADIVRRARALGW